MALISVAGIPVELDTCVPANGEGYIVTIDIEHHQVHAGCHYVCSDYDSDVDNGSPKYWHIITPNSTARMHLTMMASCSGPGLWEIYENPTTSANGTGLTEYNSDRASTNTTTMAVYKDPTVTVDGTLLLIRYVGTSGATPFGASGALVARERELILKTNEQYLIKFTPTNDNTLASVELNWYEICS